MPLCYRYNLEMILGGAVRRLVRRRGIVAPVVFTLTLGLGAATCLFSVANGLLLRPLPYPASERLVALSTVNVETGRAQRSSLHDVEDWRAQTKGLAALAAYWPTQTTLHSERDAAAVGMSMVTREFFTVLQSRPLFGRTLEHEQDAVIGYQLWQQRFGGSAGVLGRTIAIENGAYTISGVMPPEFHFQDSAEVWVPLSSYHNDTRLQPRDGRYLLAVGRLQPDADLRESQASLDAISRRLAAAYPETNRNTAARIESLHDVTVRAIRPYVLLLLMVVGALLLISCGNVANLLLGESARRRHEIAVRFALGASRARIVGQLLGESLVLGAAGGALGLAAAWWGVAAMRKLIPVPLPGGLRMDVDQTVLAFNLAVSLAAALCCGVAPALMVSRQGGLRLGRVTRGIHGTVVGAQIALSVVLLVSAALLAKTFSNLEAVDPGFRQDHLVIGHVQLGQGGNRAARVRSMLDRVRTLPGVVSAGGANTLPYSKDAGLRGDGPLISTVTPGYFAAMGIPLIEGRDFMSADTAESEPVAIVSRRAASQLRPARTIKLDQVHTVVGVVGDVKYAASETSGGEVYVCDAQLPPGHMHIVARTAGDPQALAAGLRAALAKADPTSPVTSVKTSFGLREELFWQQRLWTLLGGLFAGIAALLAAMGVFAVVGLSVTERRKELGIRSALGARRGQIFAAVLQRAMRPVVVGLFAGIGVALAFAKLLTSLLFGVAPGDLATLVAMPLALLVLSLAACAIPARRAVRVDPAEVLRQ